MNRLEIFDDVVQIMKYDSACCKDKKGANPAEYRAKISDRIADKEFVYIMQSYLATFELTGHLSFSKKDHGNLTFKVHRFSNELYVTDTTANSTLSIGDRIVEIDGLSVKEFADHHKEFLYGETEERQDCLWYNLLPYAHKITVIDNTTGVKQVHAIKLNGKWPEDNFYYCKKLNDNIAFMYLNDFANEELIQKMYAENEYLLSTCRYLIIDVRDNGGGSDSAFLPLLKYCLPEGKTLMNMDDEDEGCEINFTARNCDSRIKQCEEYKEMDLPAETLKVINDMENELKKNYGKGFVKAEPFEEKSITGSASPEKVYIITDGNCGSSGDSFVEIMSLSPKVTVVGRPTMGILDYSNLILKEYYDYIFRYPTSRLLAIDKGKHMMKHGIPVDVYIPWSPEHLKKDVDLEYILNDISNTK